MSLVRLGPSRCSFLLTRRILSRPIKCGHRSLVGWDRALFTLSQAHRAAVPRQAEGLIGLAVDHAIQGLPVGTVEGQIQESPQATRTMTARAAAGLVAAAVEVVGVLPLGARDLCLLALAGVVQVGGGMRMQRVTPLLPLLDPWLRRCSNSHLSRCSNHQ